MSIRRDPTEPERRRRPTRSPPLGGATFAGRVDVTSPGAVEAWIARAQQELGRLDVLVNNAGILRDNRVERSATRTGVPCWTCTRQAPKIPLGRTGDPTDIAAAAAFLCSEEARYVTGVVLDVDGGDRLVDPVSPVRIGSAD